MAAGAGTRHEQAELTLLGLSAQKVWKGPRDVVAVMTWAVKVGQKADASASRPSSAR